MSVTINGSTGIVSPSGGNTISSTDTGTVTQTMMASNFYAGYGPTFSAYLQTGTTQSFTGGTPAKVTMNTEDFDIGSCYDAGTNYRFTPNVAGYYNVNVSAMSRSGTGGASQGLYIYKNGSVFKGNIADAPGVNYQVALALSVVMYLNGTTDYIEAWAASAYAFTLYGSYTISGVSTPIVNFSAALIRSP